MCLKNDVTAWISIGFSLVLHLTVVRINDKLHIIQKQTTQTDKETDYKQT